MSALWTCRICNCPASNEINFVLIRYPRRFATKVTIAGNDEIGSGTGIGQITGRVRSKDDGPHKINQPSKEIVTHLPPLTEPLPNLPEAIYAEPLAESATTKVTTLSNGLRIASEPRYGQFCTVGLVLDSGPRYEVAYPSGVSHFLEKLAFNVSCRGILLCINFLN